MGQKERTETNRQILKVIEVSDVIKVLKAGNWDKQIKLGIQNIALDIYAIRTSRTVAATAISISRLSDNIDLYVKPGKIYKAHLAFFMTAGLTYTDNNVIRKSSAYDKYKSKILIRKNNMARNIIVGILDIIKAR